MSTQNIFDNIPTSLPDELFETIAQHENVKIERIISKGHTSPATGWYDQEQNEWVIVLKGEAVITLENDKEVRLLEGGHLNLPAHTKHKVSWTRPDIETIWLAVFY